MKIIQRDGAFVLRWKMDREATVYSEQVLQSETAPLARAEAARFMGEQVDLGSERTHYDHKQYDENKEKIKLRNATK